MQRGPVANPFSTALPSFMLEALNLSAQRGYTRLFSALSFKVEAGEALLITGANGTGKTTLLRMLAGLCAPAAGAIRWHGQAVHPFDPRLRAALVFAGHHPALKDDLSAEENLASLVGLADGAASKEAIRSALDTVALSRQRALPARVLSQGQRRRVGLARLTLIRRKLWLLDEPTTALDAEGTALLARLVGDHMRTGGIALVATHTALALPPARVHALALA